MNANSNAIQNHRVAAIVLAAGLSQRMGRLKPLLPFGEKPMLAWTVEHLLAVENITPVFVVTGHAAQEIMQVLSEYNLCFVHNADYASGGMLSSVQAGAQALPDDCAAFLLVLGDQPMVQPATIRSAVAAWRETNAPIVVPTYQGKRGHPVLFSSACIAEILTLHEGETLKTVVARHSDERLEVPVSDPTILMDVDTPEDYENALKLWHTIGCAGSQDGSFIGPAIV